MSSFQEDPLLIPEENHLECVLGLGHGITLSRLPAGSQPLLWLVVKQMLCLEGKGTYSPRSSTLHYLCRFLYRLVTGVDWDREQKF